MTMRNIGSPTYEGGEWVLRGSAAQRLFDKSTIGRKGAQNSLILLPSEVLFCVRHRHMTVDEDWLQQRLAEDGEILHKVAAMEAMRVPGEKVVLSPNVEHVANNVIVSEGSWALRWERASKVKSDLPRAEVIWVREFEPIDYSKLFRWASEVNSLGRIAEVLIVDEELGVTTYRVSPEDPKGTHHAVNLDDVKSGELSLFDSGAGGFLAKNVKLPEQLGSPLPEGCWLEGDEVSLLTGSDEGTESIELLQEVLRRGLLPRSGFKYGTRWRLYESRVGEGHAEWLLQPEWLAPKDWGQACLSARLANGVHKTWVCGFKSGEVWRFLAITRPPSAARWSGIRHQAHSPNLD